MVSNILRWSAKGLFVLLLLVILLITSFRLAASIRETGTRTELAPRTGHLVPTRSGGVFVQEKGPADGIPVVLFHGTAAWSELWRRTSDALAAAGFHVIALDLPPFGFSDRPGSYTRQDQAARINDVLGALKVAPAIIVGHSFGAGAATELVMRYPDRARALVLVDAALGLMAAPSDAPFVIQPKWIREILVSLTITNPVATTTLLKSMIAKKERALPEYVAILQRPTTQRDSTSDIADWLYYFLGSDRDAASADRNAYAKLKVPVSDPVGRQGHPHAGRAGPRSANAAAAGDGPDIAAGPRSHSADRRPRHVQRRPAQGARNTLDSGQNSKPAGDIMDIIRLCAWGYAALLGFVILTGYIPAFIDANDMIFGLFRRTWYADGLHLVSALWAAAAAMTSRRASELFFQLFGVFYFADGVLGLLTGSGYLDFGILINGFLNLPLSTRFFANAPHLGLGGVAILIGYVLAPRTRAVVHA